MKRFSLKLKLTAMYSFFMVLVTCLCLAVLFSLSGNEILTSAQMHLRERVQESADEIELEDGEFFMVLVTCLCLAVLFSLSGNEILTSAQMHLRERVQESADEIELEDGEFEIDSDFYSLDNNVYLALYDTGGTSAQMHLRERVQESADEIELEDGEFEIDSDFYSLDNNVYLALYDTGGDFLYGKVPPGLEQAPQFEDGKIQTVKSGTEQWYVYDVQYEMENGQEFYIRGVVSVTETQKEFLIAVRFAVILLPLTVILTVLIGYRLIRRTLLPVRQMTETVQEIQKDGDLSRRIGVSQDTGKDEFYH